CGPRTRSSGVVRRLKPPRHAAFESMITADAQARERRLAEIKEILSRTAPPEDRELLLGFAPVVFAETPDRIALGLSAEALAARIRDHFRFVAREIPPPTQLYKGVPGIHVAARNPDPAGWVAMGTANGLPQEVTVVETHTQDAPFIFESLKNYFRKAGLRVFSSVHPIFTVRRQWERVVWIGGPREEGSKEVYCHFQIERIDSRERLRHLEHAVFSVLKSVFMAVDDFEIREWGPDGKLVEATLLVGRLAKGAFTQKAAGIPILKEKLDWLLANSGVIAKSYAYREIRAIFNRFPTRELFYANVQALKEIIDRIVFMSSDDEIAVHVRKGAGYVALQTAFARSRYSYKVEEDLRRALADAFGPTSFSTSADLGAVSLLLFYFDSSRLEHPVETDRVRQITESLVMTWEDRVAKV